MTSPSDNVVPIRPDLELERGDRRLRAYVIVLATVWLAILTMALVLTPLPDPVPLFALACIVVLAEHRFVLFGDETAVSSTMIVVLASTVIFAESAPLTGPMLVGAAGGLYVPHLRMRSYSKILTNAAGLSAAGAAASGAVVPASNSQATMLATMTMLGGVLFWIANNVVVAGFLASLDTHLPTRRSVCHHTKALVSSELGVPIAATVLATALLLIQPDTTISVVVIGVLSFARPAIALRPLRLPARTGVSPLGLLAALMQLTVAICCAFLDYRSGILLLSLASAARVLGNRDSWLGTAFALPLFIAAATAGPMATTIVGGTAIFVVFAAGAYRPVRSLIPCIGAIDVIALGIAAMVAAAAASGTSDFLVAAFSTLAFITAHYAGISCVLLVRLGRLDLWAALGCVDSPTRALLFILASTAMGFLAQSTAPLAISVALLLAIAGAFAELGPALTRGVGSRSLEMSRTEVD